MTEGPRLARGGKTLYGARVGILMLETRFPRIPGDMGNAAAELVRLGADGITTTCGFLSLFQQEIAAHVGVPVATSSLMQIPFIERLLPPGKRVGVLTVSASNLTAEHLHAAGADPATPVVGTDGGSEFRRVMINDEERLDVAAAKRDIVTT